MTMPQNDALVTIVGAGVIGLTTAVRVAERGHPVQVITSVEPVETTSIAATGMVGLAFAEPMDRVPGWEAATVSELASIMQDDDAGVRTQRCLLGSRSSDARPLGIETWPGYATADRAEVPTGFEHGFWLDMTVVDMTRYLPYLLDRLATAGGVLDIYRIESLDELTSGSAVVNCTGIGARELTGDHTLTSDWGMHVIVDNPGIDHCFMEGPPGQNEWVAWMPHGDRLLIGGVIAADRVDPGFDRGEWRGRQRRRRPCRLPRRD